MQQFAFSIKQKTSPRSKEGLQELMHLSCLEVKTVRSMHGRGNDRMSIRKQRPKLETILGWRGKFPNKKQSVFVAIKTNLGRDLYQLAIEISKLTVLHNKSGLFCMQ